MNPIPSEEFQEAIDQTYYALNTSRLYNRDYFKKVQIDPQDTLTIFPNLDEYLRSITINFGLSGLLTVRSPKEMIDGYYDPLIETLNETPVWMGGDNTTSAFLSLANPPTHPTNNRVSFFTGQDDYEMTRTYGQWLEQEYIMMKGKEYLSLNEIDDYIYSPWEDKVLLDGTDGMQFSPDLSENDVIAAFVNDLSRNCYFDYERMDDSYPHIKTMIFKI